jgi:hypothetical protein
MKTKYRSAIGPVIERFVTVRRSMGLIYREQANILLSLDRFLIDSNFHDLTPAAVERFDLGV